MNKLRRCKYCKRKFYWKQGYLYAKIRRFQLLGLDIKVSTKLMHPNCFQKYQREKLSPDLLKTLMDF
jgi:hypothetical protein